MFVLELRKHGICAAWGFQHLLLDLETFAQRVWRERGQSVQSLLHGYGSGVLAVSPYAGLGSCRERIGADMHEALVKPTVHMAIFIDEMPKPSDLIGNKADSSVAYPSYPYSADCQFGDIAMRSYRRRIKLALGLLRERGNTSVIAPKGTDFQTEEICLQETRRYWRPIVEPCVPLYRRATGEGAKPDQQMMTGEAKIIYHLIAMP